MAKGGKRQEWRNQWFFSDTKDKTREMWNGNFVAFLNECDVHDEDATDPMQQGMMLFRLTEAVSLAGQKGRRKFFELADTTITALIECLSAEEPQFTPEIDFVFVSLDLEGGTTGPITELGWSTIDLRDLFNQTPQEDVIQTKNFALTNTKNGRKFLFGETTRLKKAALRETITGIFDIDDDQHPGEKRKIILLGQSPHGDIATLEKMGIVLDMLPTVKGLCNTATECQHGFGQKGKLRDLMTACGVPFDHHLLHCAGNDARFTLQLLIATIAEKLRPRTTSTASQNALERLTRLATDTVDLRPPLDPTRPMQLAASQGLLLLQSKRLQAKAKQEGWGRLFGWRTGFVYGGVGATA